MAFDQGKLGAMEKTLRRTAGLIGKKQDKPNEDGLIEGLNCIAAADTCLNDAQAIKDGVFKTVIMGTFTNGKSSIINALIGAKILPEAIKPTTAIISYIRYREGDNSIVVNFSDGSYKEMNFDNFFAEYSFSLKDEEECAKTGTVARFQNVKDSVIFCNKKLLQNGVQIIDTPGLEDKDSATKVTMDVARNANAIIYTGSAPSGGFNQCDKLFFKNNFEGKSLNNVFFVINKVDLLKSKQLADVKELIRQQLENVFTDNNGNFNEDLYNKRVFFVSAWYAIEYKTEKTEDYTDRDLPDFLRFENELEEFLTTDERSIAQFRSCITNLANAYQSAIHVSEVNKVAASKSIDDVKKDVATAQKCLDASKKTLENLEKDFKVASTKTQTIVFGELLQAVEAVNSTWEYDKEMLAEEIDFNALSQFSIAMGGLKFWKSEEERQAAFMEKVRPIMERVTKHIENKMQDAIDNLQDVTFPIVEELKKNVESAEKDININFSCMYDTFKANNPDDVEKGSTHPVKLLAAALNNDVNVVVGLLSGQDFGWMDFLKRTMTQLFVDSIFLAFGPIGWLLIAAREVYQLIIGADKFKDTFMEHTKNSVINNLKKKLTEERASLDSKIDAIFNVSYSDISAPVMSKIATEKKILDGIIANLDSKTYSFEEEAKRCDVIIDCVYNESNNIHEMFFDREISSIELLQLANTK